MATTFGVFKRATEEVVDAEHGEREDLALTSFQGSRGGTRDRNLQITLGDLWFTMSRPEVTRMIDLLQAFVAGKSLDEVTD
jgi:hypothetical protein